MPVNPSNLVAVRTAIYNQLVSEMGAGNRLAGIAAVGDSWLNEVKVFPYVSIFADGRSETITANRRKRNDMRFVVGCAYRSKTTMRDAYDNLYALMDDGNGKGLEAILRDPNHYSWGNLASWSTIKDVKYFDNIGDTKAETDTFVAYAVIQYEVSQIMDWSGGIH